MALIRECQPKSIEEWENWYFEYAFTNSKMPVRITREILIELGERLYEKITAIVIPEWLAAFKDLTLDDCINYVYNLTINRTYDGFLREKSVVNDILVNKFPEVRFEESDVDLDHAGDIDYICYVNNNAFGIQIKPVTAQANFGNYSASERMKANFRDFEKKYLGKVFIIFSLDGKINNSGIIEEIRNEIIRLNRL